MNIMPTLIDNAGAVLRKAWSVRLMAAAAVLDGAQIALSLLTPDKPPVWFVVVSAAVTIAAFAARFVAQQSLSGAPDAKPAA